MYHTEEIGPENETTFRTDFDITLWRNSRAISLFKELYTMDWGPGLDIISCNAHK